MRPKVHMGSQKLGGNKTNETSNTDAENEPNPKKDRTEEKKKAQKKYCRGNDEYWEEDEQTGEKNEEEDEEEEERQNDSNKQKNKENVKMVCYNIRSTREHFYEFITEIKEELETSTVISIVEANITDDELKFYNIPKFELTGKLRQNQSGGGILVYIKEGTQWEKIEKIKTQKSFEHLHIKIKTRENETMDVLTIYKPKHHREFLKELEEAVNELEEKKAVIMGDVNIDLNKDTNYIKEYKNLLVRNNLITRTSGITREASRKGKHSGSHIDHVHTRNVEGKGFIIKSYISDHYMVGVETQLGVRKQEKIEEIRYNNKKVKKLIETENWDIKDEIENIEEYYEKLCSKFDKIYNEAKETRIVHKNQTEIELPKRIQELIQQKNQKFENWRKEQRRTRNTENKNKDQKEIEKQQKKEEEMKKECRKMQTYVKNEIRKYKNTTTIKKINQVKDNTRKTWEEVSIIAGRRKNKNIDENILKYMTGTHKEIANNFQKTFEKQVEDININCKEEINQIAHKAKKKVKTPMKKFKLITEDEVKKIIKDMKIKGAGIDKIRIQDLKHKDKKIIRIIKNIINNSIIKKKIPKKLKTTVIRPLYKKGAHKDYNNYRQIAIQSSINKIMEKHIQGQIKEHMIKNDIIDENQWGFQEKKGTPKLIKEIVEYIYMQLKQKKHVVVLTIDYEKCFDTLAHNKIIEKLQDAGIEEEALEWCEEFFTERQTTVKVGQEFSEKRKLNKGIPQGSLLSPSIYIMYANDLGNYLEGDYKLFADDTILIAAHKDPEMARRKVEQEFRILQIWAHNNQIKINKDKTNFIHIKPKRHTLEPEQHIIFHKHECLHNKKEDCKCEETINKVDKIKYLGITIEKEFNFKNHITYLEKRLRSILYQIYKLRRCVTEKILKMIYYALVESILTYGLEAWGRADQGAKVNLQKLQDKIIENIIKTKDYKKLKTRKQKYEHLGILPLQELYEYKIIVENYYNNKYKKEPNNRYNLRNQEQNLTPIARNNYETKINYFIIPTMLNKLPEDLQKIAKIGEAKRKIKKHLMSLIQ